MNSSRKTSPEEDRRDSCYFCSETFEVGRLQGHLKHCGSILEQCPLRCGAWIQRRHRASHARDCPQGGGKRGTALPSHARPPEPTPQHTWSASDPPTACVVYLEKEIASIRLALAEETNLRQIHSSELETLKTKLMLAEERTQHFLGTLHTLRNSLDDEAERMADCTAQFKHDISNLQIALQELQSAQMSTSMRLEGTVSNLLITQHEQKKIHNLEQHIEHLKRTFFEQQSREAEDRAMLASELETLRRSLADLSQMTAYRLNAQSQATASDHLALDRLAVVELAAKQARSETEDLAQQTLCLTRDLRALSKSYVKLKSEFLEFKTRVTFEPKQDLGSDDGHLIWRIEEFSRRMKEAKEQGSVLSGPLFRTSKYGYTLKPEVHLNGLGKWLGRHITATLRLVAGPHDSLLQWPCDIHANIVLKDQAGKRSEAVDIVKSLQIRRKSSSKKHDYDDPGDVDTAEHSDRAAEITGKHTGITGKHTGITGKITGMMSKSPSETSKSMSKKSTETAITMKRQYVFIPHTCLDKFDYIVNDTVFFEFVVTQIL